MKIGIIKEGKTPPDTRVTLTPKQCATIIDKYGIDLVVQKSDIRCFSDDEYRAEGIKVVDNVDDCDILIGVKEVPISELIDNKTYFFFSHTIKKQSYNKKLIQACGKKNIKLIDYEVLTDDKGMRLIAFGVFAGMVGAHNAVLTYGKRTGLYELKPMNKCFDYAEAVSEYKKLDLPNIKVVLTGGGRVASGSANVLKDMGFTQVEPSEYLNDTFNKPVFTQLKCKDYAERKDGGEFNLSEFFKDPSNYKSIFEPYTKVSDIMINGIYWDNSAPKFFTPEQMKNKEFAIKVIADVTCDIAPVSSIPSTLRPSTIADPIYGYNIETGKEDRPFKEDVVDIMAVDNLPNEMPRDASTSFGEQFINNIIEELINETEVIKRATIVENGDLGEYFEYLRDYFE